MHVNILQYRYPDHSSLNLIMQVHTITQTFRNVFLLNHSNFSYNDTVRYKIFIVENNWVGLPYTVWRLSLWLILITTDLIRINMFL